MDSENEELSQSKLVTSNDSEIFEVSTEETLQELYHSWLGEIENSQGVYKRDPRMARLMNEKCASFIIGELKSRINVNMHFSELNDDQINWISSKTAENVMDRLMFYYEDYEIDVKDLESICDQVLDILEVILTNAKDGGMKQYKVARSKVIISKNQQSMSNNDYQIY